MVMIRAIIRPEKVYETLKTLADAGYPAVTKIEVYGRGKQKGLQVGSVFYDELPKEMLMIVVDDEVEEVIKRLKGIDCGGRGTSCPDQLAKALEQYLEENK